MPLAPVRAPFRASVRRALLVATLAVAALTAFHGSAGAQPGPDDDPNCHDPMWIYANPADRSATAALPVGDGEPLPVDDPTYPWPVVDPLAEEQAASGR